jgi:hypothetical protein
VLVPVHGFIRGDTVGLLVLVHDTDTIAHLARTLMEAAAVRLPPAPCARVYHGQLELSPDQTVARAGLTALERVDLIPEWPDELA